MAFRAVVVDDEEAARELLVEILKKRSDLDIVGVFDNSRDAIAGIRRDPPDVVFLDIRMPGRDGFDVLEVLGPSAPPVVFVTAYDEYAVHAFDIDAADYVLKPLDEERVFRAVDRAMAAASKNGAVHAPPSPANAAATTPRFERDEYLRFLPVGIKGRVVLLPVSEVSCIEADGKYVRIHAGAEQHVIRRTMQSLEARLNPKQFLRVSRSAIVNLDWIAHLEPWSRGEWRITLRDRHKVVSTHGYRQRLQKILRQ